jgi:hypothetical protein
MYPLSEENRWYITSEWKKGSINARQTGFGSGRPPPLDPTQVKKLDQTIERNRSATAAELLSYTQFNTTNRTIQRYRPRKSVVKIKTNKMYEHNRFQFASLYHRGDIKKFVSAAPLGLKFGTHMCPLASLY